LLRPFSVWMCAPPRRPQSATVSRQALWKMFHSLSSVAHTLISYVAACNAKSPLDYWIGVQGLCAACCCLGPLQDALR
jgi:hypothetical protein